MKEGEGEKNLKILSFFVGEEIEEKILRHTMFVRSAKSERKNNTIFAGKI